MTKKELENKIQMAMVRNDVASTTTDVKIVCIGSKIQSARGVFRFIDVAIIKYDLTSLIIRLSEKLYDGSKFKLQNVYNIECYLTSFKLQLIENAIDELNKGDVE